MSQQVSNVPPSPLAFTSLQLPSNFSVTESTWLISDVGLPKKYSQSIVDATVAAFSKHDAAIKEKAERSYRRRRLLDFVTLCWVFILEGWHNGSLGPLIPRIQQHYDISYSTVSLIFVMECLGFVCGAVLNVQLSQKLGFGKIIVLATLVQVALYCILTTAPPFPIFISAFFMYGLAAALQNSQVNSLVVSFKNPTKTAILHTSSGLGALMSPFVATPFSRIPDWSIFYSTLFILAISNAMALMVVFRFRDQNEVLIKSGYEPQAIGPASGNTYKDLLKHRVVHFLALFLLAYCGIEVTIGGWAINYLIKRTGGGPSSGYVSSGFFGSLALGRLMLIPLNKALGEQRAIVLYSIVAICLEIILWIVPVFLPSAVAISLVGFFLGPMFPILLNQCGHFIPAHILPGAIGWICSFGMVGTAAIPLLTGVLADAKGVTSLPPLLVSMTVVLLIVWSIVVSHRQKGSGHTLLG